MNDKPDMEDWSEITIRWPGNWASPDDMHRVISALFCHDSVLTYQQRCTEAGMREAVDFMRTVFRRLVERRSDVPKDVIQFAEGILNQLDPDHEQFDGYFPSQMVCPLHEQPERSRANGHGRMLPVFSKCPGVPRCNAGRGVRN